MADCVRRNSAVTVWPGVSISGLFWWLQLSDYNATVLISTEKWTVPDEERKWLSKWSLEKWLYREMCILEKLTEKRGENMKLKYFGEAYLLIFQWWNEACGREVEATLWSLRKCLCIEEKWYHWETIYSKYQSERLKIGSVLLYGCLAIQLAAPANSYEKTMAKSNSAACREMALRGGLCAEAVLRSAKLSCGVPVRWRDGSRIPESTALRSLIVFRLWQRKLRSRPTYFLSVYAGSVATSLSVKLKLTMLAWQWEYMATCGSCREKCMKRRVESLSMRDVWIPLFLWLEEHSEILLEAVFWRLCQKLKVEIHWREIQAIREHILSGCIIHCACPDLAAAGGCNVWLRTWREAGWKQKWSAQYKKTAIWRREIKAEERLTYVRKLQIEKRENIWRNVCDVSDYIL